MSKDGAEAHCLSRWAYDGKGNAVVKSLEDLEDAMQSLGGQKQGLYGEKWVNFTKVSSRLIHDSPGSCRNINLKGIVNLPMRQDMYFSQK